LNVPVVLVALLIAFKLLPDSHEATSPPRVDLVGALLSTSSIALLIAGLTQIVHPAGSSITLLALFAGFLVFLLLFCFLETHITHPLVPLRFFLHPNIAGSSLVTLAFSAAANTPLFFFTLYMQQVRGFSSFMTGLAFLPANLAIIGGALINARLIKWLGYKHATLVSLLLIAGAVLWFTRMSVMGKYIWMLLPGLLLLGSGLGIVQVVVTGVGTEQVTASERGLVSSILNMASQVGTAIGLAILVSLANLRITLLTGNARPSSADLVASFQWAFYGGTVFALLSILITLFTIKEVKNQRV
jgi:predicted MFS family arabinose efflux permease